MTIKTKASAARSPTTPAAPKATKPIKLPAPAVPDHFIAALPGALRFDAKTVARQHALLAQLQTARDPHRHGSGE